MPINTNNTEVMINELRSTLGKLEIALSSVTDSIVWIDTDNNIQWSNSTFDHLVGKAHINILESHFSETFPLVQNGNPVSSKEHPGNLIFKSNDNLNNIYEFHINDKTFILDVSGRKFKYGTASDSAIFVIHDITEKKKKEEEKLFELASIVQSSGDAIYSTTLDTIITSWNKGAEIMFGYTADEIIGRPVSILIPIEIRHEEQEIIEKIKRSERIENYETKRQKKDGTTIDVSLSVSPLYDPLGQILGTSKIARNITKQKLAEQELKNTAERLAASNSELESFATVASHDLQEPLRKIVAFGDRLETFCGDRLGEKGTDYLKRIKSSAKRMGQLIDDLLLFSRVTTKAKPFEKVNLNYTLQEVILDLERHIEESSGKINIGKLPTVNADKVQMRQLFQNLISNSLKFRKKDSPVTVTIDSKTLDDNLAEITVSDNGIGFDEQYLNLIFKPFHRLHTRTEYEGSGMGLAICKKIVNRHQGTITVRSAVGEGSTFIIKMPID